MLVETPFRLKMTGGDADRHMFQAYDGYTALAGFSLTLSLVTNYVETGEIRHRGNFEGRGLVKARPIEEGSVVADFVVKLAKASVLGMVGVSETAASRLLVDLTKRTIDRNLGNQTDAASPELQMLEEGRDTRGDLEALVAATEPSVKQTHNVIGFGAQSLDIYGGTKKLGNYNPSTKAYVSGSYLDKNIREKNVSVASFNVNTGSGGAYDFELKRVIPISVNKDTLSSAKSILTWGIDQYANTTGGLVTLRYQTILALDDTVKKYIVIDASIA